MTELLFHSCAACRSAPRAFAVALLAAALGLLAPAAFAQARASGAAGVPGMAELR